jgi:hypothetical protein
MDINQTINFCTNLSKQTSVPDQKEFYSNIAAWLTDYVSYLENYGSISDSDIRCSACGSADLFDGALGQPGGGIRIECVNQYDAPEMIAVSRARCCRRCGNVMPYVRNISAY